MSDDPAYSPSHVANYFLRRAEEEGLAVSPLKLQKLVYIAYGWVLATLDRRLFVEEIEAWDHGPVIPSLYHEFKHYGRAPIDALATELDWDSPEVEVRHPAIPDSDAKVRAVLDKVWQVYKRISAWSLRNLTHQKDSPWTQIHDRAEGRVIPDDLIKPHFRSKIRQYLTAAHD